MHLWIVLGVAALVLVYFLARYRELRRTEHFRQFAQRMGFKFLAEGDAKLLTRLKKFQLFALGRSRRIKNLLQGDARNVKVAIFDYHYVTSSGDDAVSRHQSVAYFDSPRLKLPQFTLSPEGLFHKLGSVFGFQDIDFSSHPGFSGRYLLRGDNEEEIRELFQRRLLRFFEGQHKICVEASGSQFVFYRQQKCINPREVEQFLEEGFEVYAQLRDSKRG